MSYIRYPTLKELRRYTRPPEGRYRLVTLVGEEVLAQIKQEFLSMEPVPLARLFKEYEMRHGRAAGTWRSPPVAGAPPPASSRPLRTKTPTTRTLSTCADSGTLT